VLEVVRGRALTYAAAQPLDLPGVLGAEVRDWHIYDSTTVRLDDALKAEYPGAGDYAAFKIHKRFSVGLGTTVDYHLSPAREHDAPHLTVDESWRGLGLLADLGYASLALLQACDRHGVHFVIRLKENWKPNVDHVAHGELSDAFVPGLALDVLLDAEVLKLDRKVIDADVRVGRGSREVRCRLVGVPTDKGYCFFLSSLPPRIAARSVADLHRGPLGHRERQQARQVLPAARRDRCPDRARRTCAASRLDGGFRHGVPADPTSTGSTRSVTSCSPARGRVQHRRDLLEAVQLAELDLPARDQAVWKSPRPPLTPSGRRSRGSSGRPKGATGLERHAPDFTIGALLPGSVPGPNRSTTALASERHSSARFPVLAIAPSPTMNPDRRSPQRRSPARLQIPS
jgi:hypothetical protein